MGDEIIASRNVSVDFSGDEPELMLLDDEFSWSFISLNSTTDNMESGDYYMALYPDKVKKLITEKKIKYIYSSNKETNNIVSELIKNNKLELVTINTMYSINGNINNTNDNYLTVMNDNLELLKKELYK